MMKHQGVLATLSFVGAIASSASAGVELIAQEIGNDVTIVGAGSLDLSLWTYEGPTSASGFLVPTLALTVGIGPAADAYIDVPNFTGPASIGSGAFAPSGPDIGSVIGIRFDNRLIVPAGYVSGGVLSGLSTWQNETLETLGLDPGIYTWTWDTEDGAGDFFTIEIIGNEPELLGDLDADGDVDFNDLLLLLASWGDCDDLRNCPADIDQSGDVTFADLLILLSNWS